MKIITHFIFLVISVYAGAQQTAYKKVISNCQEIHYLLYTPKDLDPEKNYPLLLFLHGGGESGDSIERVKTHGPPKLIAAGKEFPFYVLSPQNPHEKGFHDDRIIEKLLTQLIDSLNVDSFRIYLAGLSCGGYGAWRLAINNPDRFAAMISICAASIPIVYLDELTNLPIWLFHGEKDEAVPVELSIEAYEELKSLGGNVKLTLYPEANHDSWTETFENDSIYSWLLSHNKYDR